MVCDIFSTIFITSDGTALTVVRSATPVGRYPEGATPDGLMDMGGNVWKWMENKYDKSREARCLRGDSWFSLESNLRCSFRSWGSPGIRGSNVGFRVVRSQS